MQTYTNLKAILIDDCSTDDSAQIAKRYAQNDKRFLLIQKPQNEGLGVARNTGLDYIFSTLKPKDSDYIGFVDSDDVVAVDYFANLIYCLESHKKRGIMVAKSFNICRFNDAHYDRAIFGYRGSKIGGLVWNLSSGITTKGGKVEAWRAVYRAEFLRDLRFCNVRLAEDISFGNVVNARAVEVVYTRCARYFYRQRVGSLMQKYAYSYDESYKNFAYMLEHFVKFDLLKSHKIDISLVKNLPLGRETECFERLQNLVRGYNFNAHILARNPNLRIIAESSSFAEFRAKIKTPLKNRIKRYFRIDIRFSHNRGKIHIKLFGKVLCDK